ncbi:MAG: DUF4118 domain-containing protein [Actinobacteria bacterium]|jgi:Domain of unknown function (DUF4118)|nr:DUF4118 domain-containing protein [Actinomycetota bacterium]NBP53407.1 DUF4118 domain-containing protein [Actinomycetota bacterium]
MKRSITAVILPVSAFVVALTTSSVRDSMEIANVALLLAAIIVGSALIDWTAGLTTALVGAVSLNYFHTEPVHSLRITATSDVIAVALLGFLGVAVSAGTALRVSERVRRYHASLALSGAEALTRPQPAPTMWHAAVDAESAELAMLSARLVPSGTERLPVIARHAAGPDDRTSPQGTVRIPAGGAVVVLRDPRLHRDLVLSPRDAGTTLEVRRAAIFMLADNVELSLSQPEVTNGRLVM